ncbi:MAG: hypothetical protein J2P20_21805, partial [Pseudonocardia sp.]|nr:hypothetical protein [Pseudonocardia sp.]
MNHGGGDEPGPRSRRHRHDTEAPEGLSVADLLARHGVESGDGGSSRRHRLPDTDPDPDHPAPPLDAPEPDNLAEPEPPEPPKPPEPGVGPVTAAEARPGSVPRRTVPPYPATNLFAQLGKAEPDDSPTDVVPRVPAEAASSTRTEAPEPAEAPDP